MALSAFLTSDKNYKKSAALKLAILKTDPTKASVAKIVKTSLLITSLVTTSIFSVNLVQAQELTELIKLDIEDLLNITVTITNDKNTDERHVFSSFSKVQAEQWQTFSADRLLETLKYTPGIDIHTTIGGGQSLSVRGYPNSTGSARGKALLFDGIPLNGYAFGTSLYSKSFLSPELLNSIELAKGPISSFYGNDAFHGAILLVPWQNSQDFASVTLSQTDNLQTSFNAKVQHSYANNLSVSTVIQGTNQASDSTSPQYQPTESFSYKNKYHSYSAYSKISSDFGTLGLLVNRSKTDDFPDIATSDSFRYSEVDNIETNLLYYKHNWSPIDNLTLKPAVWFNQSQYDLLFKQPHEYITWTDRQLGAKLLAEQFIGENQLTYGVEYLTSKVIESRINPLGAPVAYSPYHQASKDIYTLLFQYERAFWRKQLLFSAGMRLDHFTNTNNNEFSPKLGLIWLADERNTLKLMYAQGYRAPTAGEFAGTSIFLGNDSLKGETLSNVELLYLYKDDNLRLNLNLFNNNWDDAIVTLPSQAATDKGLNAEFVNSGHYRSWGHELELLYFIDQLNAWTFVNLAKNKSKNSDTDSYFTTYPSDTLAYGVNTTYQAWDISLKALHKFNRTDKEGSTTELKDYSSVDFFVKYQAGRYSWQVNVDNLLNKNNIEPSIWGVTGGIEQLGRRIKLSFSYQINL